MERVTDRGLTRISYGGPRYEYVTRRPITAGNGVGQSVQFAEERLADGTSVPLGISFYAKASATAGPFPFDQTFSVGYWSTTTAQGFGGPHDWQDRKPGQAGIFAGQEFPFLLAAVDPAAEARLAGLDQAITGGRYLKAGETVDRDLKYQGKKIDSFVEVPLLASDLPYADQQDEVVIRRLPAAAAGKAVEGLDARSYRAYLDRQPGEVVKRVTIESADAYRDMIDGWQHIAADSFEPLTRYWVPGATEYRQEGERRVAAVPVVNGRDAWKDPAWRQAGLPDEYARAPIGSADTQFRTLSPRFIEGDIGSVTTRIVGRFDPARLPGLSELARVPMETYNPPVAAPGDNRTSELLKGRPLLPNDNVAGYLQAPPLLLTSFDALERIKDKTAGEPKAQAPISVIRVRVKGVTGPDPVSRERISQVAQDVVKATGLDVDITIGSSPSPVTVDLPAGSHGRPALTLREGWVNKGVAYRILNEADRKSLVLFVLVLVVCGLFVVNASSAAVRARRSELRVLACLGWSRLRLFWAVLAEVGVIGLLAGGIAAALAWPLIGSLGLPAPGSRTLLAVPAALLLSLAAGLAPAWRASTVMPAEAVRPAVRLPRRARSPRGVTGLALTGLTRAPGRALLGAAAPAVAVAGLTVLLGVTYGFRGRVVGSLLGDAVVVQARPQDYAAIGLLFVLAALAVADVIYLGVRERDAELAALRAAGWSSRSLSRLVVTEGAAVGLVGALLGMAAGVIASLAFTGSLSWGDSADGLPVAGVVVIAALVAGIIAVVLAALAALVPALLSSASRWPGSSLGNEVGRIRPARAVCVDRIFT
jgi:hypothetical protein